MPGDSGNDADISTSQTRNRSTYRLGILLLLCVVFIWVGSSFLVSSLFGEHDYNRPFFITYLNTSTFSLYLLGWWWKKKKNHFITGQLKRSSSSDSDFGTFEGQPDAENNQIQSQNIFAEDKLSFKETAQLGVMFCFLWFLANVTQNASLAYTTVANSSILTSTSVGSLAGVEKFTALRLGAVIISIMGVYLIMNHGKVSGETDNSMPLSWWGDTLALLSAVVYGCYTTLLKWKIGDESRIDSALFFGFVGISNILLLWPLFPILQGLGTESFQLPSSSEVWGIILVNAFVGTFLSDYLWLQSILMTTPLVVTLGLSLTIPLSIAGDVILKGAHPGLGYFVGAALVLLGFCGAPYLEMSAFGIFFGRRSRNSSAPDNSPSVNFTKDHQRLNSNVSKKATKSRVLNEVSNSTVSPSPTLTPSQTPPHQPQSNSTKHGIRSPKGPDHHHLKAKAHINRNIANSREASRDGPAEQRKRGYSERSESPYTPYPKSKKLADDRRRRHAMTTTTAVGNVKRPAELNQRSSSKAKSQVALPKESYYESQKDRKRISSPLSDTLVEVARDENMARRNFLENEDTSANVTPTLTASSVSLSLEEDSPTLNNAADSPSGRNTTTTSYSNIALDKPPIDSIQIITKLGTKYVEYFKFVPKDSSSSSSSRNSSGLQTAKPIKKQLDIKVFYPRSGSSEVFKLVVPIVGRPDVNATHEYVPITDVIQTIEAIGKYLIRDDEISDKVCNESTGIVRLLERARNKKDGIAFIDAINKYNSIAEKLWKKRQDSDKPSSGFGIDGKALPYDLVTHILDQVYNRVVAPKVELLRNYKAFSNNVYGEVNPILVDEFIKRTGLKYGQVFVDLGCGVGNVVLQAVAQTGCSGYGIEVMEIPARLAKRQAREFVSRMNQYMLKTGETNIVQGDFLENTEIHKILKKANVVLVNNYAFDSRLNQNLMQLFLDLEDGTQIISLRPFVSMDFKISARNAGSPESILTIKKYPYWSDCVSWTSNSGEYYIQNVDRSRLQRFFERHQY
ncbi:Nucleosomal histone H3-Lys79 methylase [Mycoemilia scoparia]|uniref:Histone-lysine N-methyltransferase, H3 lysine-79 specific n=1 Tax=Mycoemilia scoparia TaxID=417184 RepID=A0A9W7ZZ84_9FUNG|nr:Nucleosomal histone H3-Lys79 methylase [Mycoemilia scoparia]